MPVPHCLFRGGVESGLLGEGEGGKRLKGRERGVGGAVDPWRLGLALAGAGHYGRGAE